MVAAAQAGMRPAEFWDSSPWEVAVVLEAHQENKSWVMETLAWMASNIMTMWTSKGKRVKAADLYKRGDAAPQFINPEDFREYMRAQKERIEGE